MWQKKNMIAIADEKKTDSFTDSDFTIKFDKIKGDIEATGLSTIW